MTGPRTLMAVALTDGAEKGSEMNGKTETQTLWLRER
jgi:hypothetical protein